MLNKKCKVYIASPYTLGDAGTNVKKQLDMAGLLLDIGLIPFAPLTTHFLHMANPKTYETWMDFDFEWVKACDSLLRLPGESKGADSEMGIALRYDIPIFNDLIPLLDWCYHIGWYMDEIDRVAVLESYNKIINVDSTLHI